MKRFNYISAVTLSILIATNTQLSYVEASTPSNINIFVNDNKIIGEQPIIKDGVTYLPIRSIGDALGINVSYDSKTQDVILSGDKNIVFTVGSSTYNVDGKSYTMDSKPFIQSGKTYLPLRAVASAFGCEINWDNKTKSIFITTTSNDTSTLNVAMVTDSGTIDDKSFNQSTWEGITTYTEDYSDDVSSTFIRPSGEGEQDYLDAINHLVDSGSEVIFLPGFKFETAVNKAQYTYPETKFIIIDGVPHNGDYELDIAENTEAILFSESEPGFYAGLVSALTSETGKVAFIGGMEIPAVQKFGWGYVAGVAYANQNYGTNVVVSDYIYQGTFNDVGGGQNLANTLYDSGCDIIFHAAGGVGVGVIYEAKTRRQDGENIWVVGVDVDQYTEGIIEDGTSVVLTSAMKHLDNATYTVIDEINNGKFKGGQVILADSTDNAVGLPDNNPNLTDKTIEIYNEVYDLVASEKLVVPTTREELEAFLKECNYTTPTGVQY